MNKGKLSTFILILALIIGLSLLLYPSFSNYWNEQHQTRAIANYQNDVSLLDDQEYTDIWRSAVDFNLTLRSRENSYTLTDQMQMQYMQELNVSGDGIMGYIEIPSIGVYLPLYHGTEENVLSVAIGHLEWTSLPVGGESTHCVVSGHRGLPSARLFTDLDQLIVGDVFMLHVLDELLTYEVDQILIVEPDDTDALLIEEGKDLVTLVTCTPYGVNSHRLLVRGHRVENAEETVTVRVSSDAVQVEPLVVAAILVGPVLLLLMALVLTIDHFINKNRNSPN